MTVREKKNDKPGTNQGSLKAGDTEMFKLVTFNIRCDYGQDESDCNGYLLAFS